MWHYHSIKCCTEDGSLFWPKNILEAIKFRKAHSLPSTGLCKLASQLTVNDILEQHGGVFSFNVIMASGCNKNRTLPPIIIRLSPLILHQGKTVNLISHQATNHVFPKQTLSMEWNNCQGCSLVMSPHQRPGQSRGQER